MENMGLGITFRLDDMFTEAASRVNSSFVNLQQSASDSIVQINKVQESLNSASQGISAAVPAINNLEKAVSPLSAQMANAGLEAEAAAQSISGAALELKPAETAMEGVAKAAQSTVPAMNSAETAMEGVAKKATSAKTDLLKLKEGFESIREFGMRLAVFGGAITGAGLATVYSAAATQTALGELAAVGIKDLSGMERAAARFSNQWAGVTKPLFISSAYDIKSALANLSDDSIARFTSLSAITAKATKSSVVDMGKAFTTMYGIFKPIMKDIGDIDFAEQLAGGMAQTTAAFRTEGTELNAFFQNLGAVAAAANVSMQDQLAIAGQLGGVYRGSESGTLYKSFIMNAAKAGRELNLSFVGPAGQLKGISEILDLIKGKFPDLSQAAAGVEIARAFGSDEAYKFLVQMSMGADQLSGNIKDIEKAMERGSGVAVDMAMMMNKGIGEQMDILKQRMHNAFEEIGKAAAPILTPLAGIISGFALLVQVVSERFPNLTGLIVRSTFLFGGLTAAVGLLLAGLATLALTAPVISKGLLTMGITAEVAKGGFLSMAKAAWASSFSARAAIKPVISSLLAIGLPLLAISAAAVAVKLAWDKNFLGIRTSVIKAFEPIKSAVSTIYSAWQSLKNGIVEIDGETADKLQASGMFGFVKNMLMFLFRAKSFFSGVFDGVKEALTPIFDEMRVALSELWKSLRPAIEGFGRIFQYLRGGAVEGLGATFYYVVDAIGESVDWLQSKFEDMFSWVFEKIDWLNKKTEGVLGWLKGEKNININATKQQAQVLLPAFSGGGLYSSGGGISPAGYSRVAPMLPTSVLIERNQTVRERMRTEKTNTFVNNKAGEQPTTLITQVHLDGRVVAEAVNNVNKKEITRRS